MTAIVFRVAWNNKGWKDACDTPDKDPFCWYCFEGILKILPPKKGDPSCSGDCWERRLITGLKWGCTPRGRVYGPNAYQGVSAFFVFKQPDGNYTIWGKTKVSAVDTQPMKSANSFEDGYAFIHFESFNPLPREKWVTGLSDVDLVGARWLQGRHRYIDANQENYLDQLISGQIPLKNVKSIAIKPVANTADNIVLGTTVAQSIYQRLEAIAASEGRAIDELIREAIAKWLGTK